MRVLVLGTLICCACCFSQPVFAGGGGNGQPEGDEISMVVLDELFTQASKQWQTTTDAVWDAYSSGKLSVKATNATQQSFSLHSDHHGDLTVSLQGEVQNRRASDDAAVAKMRAALLLDTEELTDNEGGTEDE